MSPAAADDGSGSPPCLTPVAPPVERRWVPLPSDVVDEETGEGTGARGPLRPAP